MTPGREANEGERRARVPSLGALRQWVKESESESRQRGEEEEEEAGRPAGERAAAAAGAASHVSRPTLLPPV